MNSNSSKDALRLVLVGGGHAHLHVLQEMKKRNIEGLQVILISEFPYQYYSGMAANFIEGIYQEEEIRFNLRELCRKHKIEFIEGRVTGVNGDLKKIILSDGTEVPFSILSMDTGSKMAGSSLVGVETHGVMIKPLVNLHKIRKACEENTHGESRLVIVGAGAAGVEIALAVQSHKEKLKQKVTLTLVEFGDSILRGYQERLKKQVMDLLVSKNIKVMFNTKVTEIDKEYLKTTTGERIEYDDLIWAGGGAADSFYKESGILVDEKGFMLVNSYLQSLSHPFIFGAGDCITFSNYDYVTKVGVYAIREAPLLVENITRYSQGKPLQVYTPQRTYLSILSLGHKVGILQYGKIVVKGKNFWKIKDYIDQSFMRRYR